MAAIDGEFISQYYKFLKATKERMQSRAVSAEQKPVQAYTVGLTT